MVSLPHIEKVHDLVATTHQINNELKAKMRNIQDVRFKPPHADNILDALGSQTFLDSSRMSLAKFLLSDHRKYAESVEAVNKLHGIYCEGIDRLTKVRDKLPEEIVNAHAEALSGRKEYSHFEKVTSDNGIQHHEIYPIFDTLGNYERCEDRTGRLLAALEAGRKAHSELDLDSLNPDKRRELENRLKDRFKNAVHASMYDTREEFERHKTRLEELGKEELERKSRA